MEVILHIVLSRYFIGTVLFLVCFFMALSIIFRAEKYRVLDRTAKHVVATWEKFLHYVNETTEKRIREEERLQKEQGNREKKHFLYRLDEAMLQTGLKKKVPFLTVELTLVLLFLFLLCVMVVTAEIADSLLIGILAVGISFMILKEVVQMIIRRRQKQVEDNIIQFANLIENYARTSDDIVQILRKISIYLEEPLKTAVEDCYMEAYTTGDFSTACAHLDAGIGNRYLADMLTNIESCSRHRANYEEVIRGNKEIIRKYLAERDVQREIARNARVEIVILLIMGGIVMYSFQGVIPEGMQLFSGGSLLSKVFTGVIGIVVFISIRVMMSIGDKEA